LDKKNACSLKTLLDNLNHNISGIQNERFFVYVPEIPVRGNRIKVCVEDRRDNKTYERYFKWHVLRLKNGDCLYSVDMMVWINAVVAILY